MELDPILLEILWARLISIAEEQARALFKASFSTAVGETEDYASTIHDRDGNLITQSTSTGTVAMLTGMAKSIKHLLRHYPAESLYPGDVLICNDPWLLSGHKYDVTMATPFFRENRLIGLAATNVHVVDIGGIGFSLDAKETYDEGLTIPPLKFFKQGEPNEDLLKFLRHNVRLPEQVIGDLMAQVAANEGGGRKVLELLEEYGLADLESLSNAIIARSEQAMRDAIAALPDGVYRHEVLMDGFEQPLRVAVALEVKGGEISADFSGTSPQVDRAINGVLNVTYGFTVYALKCALLPDVPNNEGSFRPIKVVAPEGSILNARHPAAVAARHLLYSFITAAVFGALAKVIPDRVIADSGAHLIISLKGMNQRGDRFVYFFATRCGMGATPQRDGYSGTMFPASVGTVPVEVLESVSPVFVRRKGFVPDSGGPGRNRGGCDQEICFHMRSPTPITLSAMFERTRFPAQGFLGGGDGRCGRVEVDGQPISPKGRTSISPGQEICLAGGGGGGFGPPEERDPDLVVRDVVHGLVSPESARENYRVAVDVKRRTVDREKTEQLRAP